MSPESSPSSAPRPITVPQFMRAKEQGRKLSVLTCYDYLWARLLDEAGVDALLVGDSLAMVVQGHATTLPVTLEQIIYHAQLVVRGTKRALVIVDLPFMTYQVSPQEALRNAGEILKQTGASAVKLEGGVHQAETICRLVEADIPVMAHVGMKPQSVLNRGGMGRVERDSQRILDDARAAEDAGAFGIVLELMPRSIAAEVTRTLKIPTIGIGAGPECDGQVLVTPDMLGMTRGFNPKFVKHFAELGDAIVGAARQYSDEVRNGIFPDAAHSHD